MALNPAKDDPNYREELLRRVREPETFGDFAAKGLRDAAELKGPEALKQHDAPLLKEAETKAAKASKENQVNPQRG
jgi:hypothetical protein